MDKLFIIDATSYVYRSYFALPPMSNPQGVATQGLYGFIRSILKLQIDFQPTHVVAVFDGPRNKEARIALYEHYKVHRKEMPEDLKPQIENSQKFCALYGLPCLSIPGVEADDVIGTLAKWGEKQGAHVYVCSSDKDLYQLVTEKVHILNVHKNNLILDAEKVQEQFGVTPEQIVDYLAIVGDTSDNIPGIKGMGPKAAVSLLSQFKTLDYLLNNIDLVPGEKKQMLLRQESELARLSYALAKINTDIACPCEKEFLKLKEINFAELIHFYDEMRFNSLLKDLSQRYQPISEKPSDEFFLITNLEEAKDKLAELKQQKQPICFHIEYDSRKHLLDRSIVGIAFAFSENKAMYLSVSDIPEINEEINSLFSDPNIEFYTHDFKSQLHVLKNQSIAIPNVVFDTNLASYLVSTHSHRHTIAELASDYFSELLPSLKEFSGKKKETLVVDILSQDSYLWVCKLATIVYRSKIILEKELKVKNLQKLFEELEMPLLFVLCNIERQGIALDKKVLSDLQIEVQSKLTLLENQIYESAGEKFNINSPKQLAAILYEKLQLSAPKKRGESNLSTAVDVLQSIAWQHPIISYIMEYRGLEKLRSTYLSPLLDEVYPKTGRIHCTLNQTVTATGRLSCQDPNLQNIPTRTDYGRQIRKAFVPSNAESLFLSADYSQIELRILAHLSEDPLLLEAFHKNLDIHATTASQVFHIPLEQVTAEQRYRAKAINFGIVYGQQGFGLAQELNVSVAEASQFIDLYFSKYQRVKEYLEGQKKIALEKGHVTTMLNRRRAIPDIANKNTHIRLAAERLAINTPIQGSAADLIKLAMIKVEKSLQTENLKAQIILQIHDELLFEVPLEEKGQVEALVKKEMEGIWDLKVPLLVNLNWGGSWFDC